jgi:hypothetical protein
VLTPEKLREAATSGRRSALYRWMLENYDQFSRTVAEAGRPNWRELARTFGEAGLLDRLGKSPSAEGARQTWVLVRAAVAKDPDLPGKLSRSDVARPAAPAAPARRSERQPAPIKPLVVDAVRPVNPVEASAPPRKRVQLRSAQPLATNEAPTLDGSTLPRPLHPNLKD